VIYGVQLIELSLKARQLSKLRRSQIVGWNPFWRKLLSNESRPFLGTTETGGQNFQHYLLPLAQSSRRVSSESLSKKYSGLVVASESFQQLES
jgi:hypothetical protein